MIIKLSPQRRDDILTVVKSGDVLTINGESYDFSSVPDGGTIPPRTVPCAWIVGPVDRINGEIVLTLILPHGANPAPDVANPAPLTAVPDGTVQLPGGAS